MNLTIKAGVSDTIAGKKYPALFSMTKTTEEESWTGNVCTLTRSKEITWARIVDEAAKEKAIDGKDIDSVEV